MNDPNELERQLEPQLRDFESQLRALKPRAPKFNPDVIARPPEITPRGLFWSHAATWVAGVAVGCLLMVVWPDSMEPTSTSERIPSQPAVSDTPSDKSVEVVLLESAPSLPRSGSVTHQIESLMTTKSGQQRLLVSSHLAVAPTYATQQPVNRLPSSSAVMQWEFDSAPKTRQQLMSELLNWRHF